MSKRKKLYIAAAIFFFAAAVTASLLVASPQEAIERFKYSEDSAEDQMMDPLILCGRRAAPLILEEIADPNMPRRRYAIAFLGNLQYTPSVPLLKSILADSSQPDVIRGDALRAIAATDLE